MIFVRYQTGYVSSELIKEVYWTWIKEGLDENKYSVKLALSQMDGEEVVTLVVEEGLTLEAAMAVAKLICQNIYLAEEGVSYDEGVGIFDVLKGQVREQDTSDD
jgi:hypothetical protein